MEGYKLTQEEAEAAIKEAQQKKEAAMKYDEDLLRRRKWETELRRPWNPEELLIFVKWKAQKKGIEFLIDNDNRSVIEALCQYFCNDPAFEHCGHGSLKKGIMLCGPVGTGKSTIMNLFRANQKRSYNIVSCRFLADKFKQDGEQVLHIWSRPISVPTDSATFYQNQIGSCFDDLGTETDKRHFGDSVNVMADILLNRYDAATAPFHYTHLTTNLTVDEIENEYGNRVRSRMREMFNMLELKGQDRRK